jgi:hypothetical protein
VFVGCGVAAVEVVVVALDLFDDPKGVFERRDAFLVLLGVRKGEVLSKLRGVPNSNADDLLDLRSVALLVFGVDCGVAPKPLEE